MSILGTARAKLAFGAAGAVVLAGTAGAAYAATSGPGRSGSGSTSAAAAIATAASGPNPASTPPARSARAGATAVGPVRRLLRRADQATVEVKVHGAWVSYTIDRGPVSAVTPTSITLALPDGHSVTEHITGNTRFRGVTSARAVRVGAVAVTVSQNGSALAVAQRTGTPTSSNGASTSATTTAAA